MPKNKEVKTEGETRYGAEGAPVIKHGGNTADQDAVVREQSPKDFYGKGEATK